MASLVAKAGRLPTRAAVKLAADHAPAKCVAGAAAHVAGVRALSTVEQESSATDEALAAVTELSTSRNAAHQRSVPRPALAAAVPIDSSRMNARNRNFHTYFVTHLPSSSMHPDARIMGPGHKLPRDASTPHTPDPGAGPAVRLPNMPSRDLTVVRIPLRRAKHHFGSACSRGSRPYNEDTDQAGIINIPAFAKRAPMSVQHKPGEPRSADNAMGDPQTFYFGVFDGHGGTQCSHFLRDELHGYIEEAATIFGLKSSLRKRKPGRADKPTITKEEALQSVRMKQPESVAKEVEEALAPEEDDNGNVMKKSSPVHGKPLQSEHAVPAKLQDYQKAIQLERDLVKEYADTIGGYFRRFNPEHFDIKDEDSPSQSVVSAESALTYAFLRADLDFVTAQARKADPDDSRISDTPLNNDEILGAPHAPPSGHGIGGAIRFKGGSTASIALISTPTATPFWHPGAHSTLLVAHVGDSRILLCDTATGLPQALTSDHHPSTPTESRRLRRYAPAGSMVSGDSFGEERIAGLANSRAFGDIKSKRIGVSAEPEITRVELGPAQYSFIVLMSDGISGTLSDQEIVDVIKEAKTPEEGAKAVVDYATEVSSDGDNATCQVVRLGGWERRSEGGLGSMGTKEVRDMRLAESQDPRRGKR